MLEPSGSFAGPNHSILPRVERTLELMHRWGYAPTVDALAKDLIGGAFPPADLRTAIVGSSPIHLVDPFVCLRGQEHLIGKSRDRHRANQLVNGHATAIATAFARNLVRSCPFVECVALSGSVASGGFVPTDDIDLDLFVRDGTKYLTYAVSLLLGFLFALRHKQAGPIRKIICINVIWTRRQSLPFARTDTDLAFELLRCKPLFGFRHFRHVILANGWATAHFPQLALTSGIDVPRPNLNLVGRVLGWIARHSRLLSVSEQIGRILSYAAYRTVHRMRRRDRNAMERLAFLLRVKYPYEVFQD